MKMKKVIALVLTFIMIIASIPASVLALNWDGSSAGGSTNAVNGSNTGYVIRSTDDSACVVGYRFSVVDSSGALKVNKVIDVYRNTSNGDNAYQSSAKFSKKYNKKQLIANKNATLSTTQNTTNCYKESSMGFVKTLPNPSSIESWQTYEANINKVLSKIGVGSVSNMSYGDKVLIEPLFDICLAGEYQSLTVSEIAYCGRSVLGGSSNGGTSTSSSSWGFIANYTNRIWPNKLFTPDGQGLWTGVSAIGSSTKATFDTILTKGYGVGIAYNETSNITYTVKFDGNDATSGSTASMSMTSGVTKNLTANGFVKTGNVFNGWNTKADGTGTSFTDKQSVKNLSTTNGATVTLYAQWTANVLTISFDCYGYDVTIDTSKGYSLKTYNRLCTTTERNKTIGGTPNVYYQVVNYGGKLGTNGLHDFSTFGLSAPLGYKFDCWKSGYKSFDESTQYAASAFTSDLADGDANIWLTAEFEPITYEVRYMSNGGSGSMSDSTHTYDSSKRLTYNSYTRTGYTFECWNTKADGTGTEYSDGESVINLSDTQDDVIYLYAQWTRKTYTVSYSANGGSGAPSSQTKEYGVSLKLSTTKPTRTGYGFKNWNTKYDGSGVSYSSGSYYYTNADIKLFAQWSANEYTVSYNANGGTGAPSSQTKEHDSTLTLSSVQPTKTGYTFMGWNTESDGTGATYSAGGKYSGNADLTLYAKWAKSNYTISYNANGGANAPSSQTKEHGVSLRLTNDQPIRDGYRFWMWNTKADGTGTDYPSGGYYVTNDDVTLYAMWKGESYTVEYKANGGVGVPSIQFKEQDVDLILSSDKPTRTGYSFTGWNTALSGTGVSYSPGSKYTGNSNLILYAQWSPDKYVVKYDANGGINAPISQTKVYGVSLTLSSDKPTRTGYTFNGWNTKSDGTGQNYSSGVSYVSNADIVLYAKWLPNEYVVKYDANGGTNEPDSQTKTHGVALKLSSSVPTKEHFIFDSWNTKADGTGTRYNPEDLYVENADLTLYAQWNLAVETHHLSLEAITPNAAYRERTMVMTSFYIVNDTEIDCIPSDEITVEFNVRKNGEVINTVTKTNVIVPANEKNILYFKWAVPENLSGSIITISGEIIEDGWSYGLVNRQYTTCKYIESSTPDTQYEEKAPEGFSVSPIPEEDRSNTYASWSEWEYTGTAFRKRNYGIGFGDAEATLSPSIGSNATKVDGVWQTKSGYGVNLDLVNMVTRKNGDILASSSTQYASSQYVCAYFPEYNYSNEVGCFQILSLSNAYWEFPFTSMYGSSHFIPLWYPDGDYTILITQSDFWTPMGMLSRTIRSDSVKISGNAYDDWYIG